jgi:hypothetical protein
MARLIAMFALVISLSIPALATRGGSHHISTRIHVPKAPKAHKPRLKKPKGAKAPKPAKPMTLKQLKALFGN